MMLALSLLTSILFGASLLALLIPDQLKRLPISFFAGLSISMGLGITSCIFFLWKVFGGVNPNHFIAIEVILLAAALAGAILKFTPFLKLAGPARSAGWPILALLLLLCAALLAFGFQSRQNPHGEWDAWAIWNQHARFMFRGGANWADCFIPEMHRSHPDYPLLLPGSVARAWTWMGNDRTSAPVAVAGLVLASLALTLFGLVKHFGGGVRSIAAAAVLLGTPFVISLASYQYADIPLACFILMTIGLGLLADSSSERKAGYLALAGIAAGLAAWTKNEGMLFAFVYLLCRVIFKAKASGVRAAISDCRSIIFGLVPVLAVVLVFKFNYAPPSDLLTPTEDVPPLMARITDPGRWGFVISKTIRGIISFGDWRVFRNINLSAPIIMLGWLIIARFRKTRPNGLGLAAICLLLMLLAYMAVYASTWQDLAWHINTSLTRLLAQLWPSAILVFCLAAGYPGRRD